MKEIIKKIEEVDDIPGILEYSLGEGYRITTNRQEIYVLIGNEQSCCESFGYFSAEDDLSTFIGSELLDIKQVDTDLNVKNTKDAVGEYGVDDGGIMFVNFETNKGVMQLSVYNAHNGYYGHSTAIRSKQLIFDGGL